MRVSDLGIILRKMPVLLLETKVLTLSFLELGVLHL